MSYKKVNEDLKQDSDSEDDQYERQGEKDLIQRMYEGGQGSTNDRFQQQYGDDVGNFNVRNSGIQNGLVENRGCTDIFCLIIFLAFLGSLGYLTYYANANGDVAKIIAPVYYDIDGNPQLCGEESGFTKQKYLYLTKLGPETMLDLFHYGMCVDSCPKTAEDTLTCVENKYVKCDQPLKVRKTFTMLRYCIPDITNNASILPETKTKWLALWDQFKSSSAGSYVNDLYLASTAIWASIAMAPIYCFIFIAIMSAFAETIAWLCVAVVQLGLIAGGVLCYMYRGYMTETFNNETVNMKVTGADRIDKDVYMYKNISDSYNQNMQYLLIGMIVFGIMALLFACCIVVGYKSLKLAIDVIDASADFLYKTKRIILVPILYFFVTVIIIFVWLGMFICVLSMNEIKPSDSKIPQMKSITWTSDANYYLSWYMIFAIFWLVAFIEYKTNFIVQVSAASYYFDSNSSQEGDASVGTGFRFAYMNHMGSLAIGSFIIGAIRLVKFIFVYLARRASKASGENKISEMTIKCGLCYIKCLEKVTDYINEAAFCYMAVSGENFTTSAWNGFLLNIKHLLQFSFANLIASVFMFIGKIGITVGNVFSLLFIMKTITKDSEEISSIFGPCLVVGLFTYFTASVFLGLFDTAVMSMMTSLAIDMDMNNGTPMFGPPTFHENVKKITQSNQDYQDRQKQ